MSPMADERGEERDWVVLRRYDDATLAQIALDFLRDSGVSVALQGNSGATSILNRFDTVLDIRLVVPSDELEHAREALQALTPSADQLEPEPPREGEHGWHGPYRANRARALAHKDDGDHAPPRRFRRAAIVLAFAVPIGGAHFYARHNHAGAVFAIATVLYFFAGISVGATAFVVAATILVALDAAFGLRAVARHNEGRIPAPRSQVATAVACAVAALTAGVVLTSAS